MVDSMGKNPIKYNRPIPGTIEEPTTLLEAFRTGEIVKFSYGKRQKMGEVGGWKHDPVPRLLVFYDDGNKYIEGINTNYLPTKYLVVLMKLTVAFPGIDGVGLYNIVKKSASEAVKKGYRKYYRTSMHNVKKNAPMTSTNIQDKKKISQSKNIIRSTKKEPKTKVPSIKLTNIKHEKD